MQFKEANAVLAMAQDEYEPLPVRAWPDGRMAFCMRLSPEELEHVAKTRTLWVQQLTFGNAFQPMALSLLPPEDL